MSLLDHCPAPARHASRVATADIAQIATAVALLLVFGGTALLAPASEVDPAGWRGNAAPYAVTSR